VLKVLRQEWLQVAFLHWPCPTEAVAAHLPAGLSVDEFEGSAWLSIIPFTMNRVRPSGLPPVPGVSRFPETNLRTYVRGPDGRPGLLFFSLDARSRWITLTAPRLLGVPYLYAELSVEQQAEEVRYRGTRADGRAAYDIRVRTGEPTPGDERDRWLTDRWCAYTHHLGKLLEIPVTHEPWPLRTATCTALAETLTSAAGLPAPSDPLVHYSDGVTDVAFGVPRIVG
jgi:uncharacterized protein YqjF (DUF2071 family)